MLVLVVYETKNTFFHKIVRNDDVTPLKKIGKNGMQMSYGCVYYSTIQISFSDLKKEIGNHRVISIFHFQFENEN